MHSNVAEVIGTVRYSLIRLRISGNIVLPMKGNLALLVDMSLSFSFYMRSNNYRCFGDNLIKFPISLTSDSASLITLHCFPHSFKHKLTE